MSKNRTIPLNIRCMLWGRASGRCEFCNELLTIHPMTKETVNLADVSHIIGFSEDGPRGEKELSTDLAKDISNLMLLCKKCHKNIDENSGNYPIEMLRKIKNTHEQRIEVVTGIADDRQSHILLYGANVGGHSSPLSYQKAAGALFPDWYPADTTPITLGMTNSSFVDHDAEFWRIESDQLRNMVTQQVRPRLANGTIGHLSIFAFAPQPLLILLGFLLSDIPAAETYQLHREPPNWKWREHPTDFDYIISEPTTISGPPALVLTLSGTIADDRITSVLKDGVTIWRVTIAEPHNDFLKSRQQLQLFRKKMRLLLDRIKTRHGEESIIHVFPATPVAIAVELGRIIMPKTDLTLKLYDENKRLGGFTYALDINRIV